MANVIHLDSVQETHWVYMMVPKKRYPERVKIGLTDSLKKRKRALEHACGEELVCIWSIPFARREWAANIEKLIHDILKKHRLKGEWFALCPEVAALPEYMKDQGFDYIRDWKNEHL